MTLVGADGVQTRRMLLLTLHLKAIIHTFVYVLAIDAVAAKTCPTFAFITAKKVDTNGVLAAGVAAV